MIAIAQDQNISKAAERLHVSQQTLSEMLKKVEDEVGVTLIKRGRPMELTQAGWVFVKRSAEILGIYKDMLSEIEEISEKARTRVTVAVPTTETPPFLPDLLTEFSKEYPGIEVKIIKCEPKDAARNAGSFDLYFSTLPLGSELENEVILEETYAVAFTSGLAAATYGKRWPDVVSELIEKKSINVLKDMPFIFLCNREDEIVLDQKLIFQDASFSPKVAFQSDNSELNSNMCRLGRGAYVATMDYCRRRFIDSSENDVMLYPIDTVISPVVIALSHRKGMSLTKACRCFIDAAKRYLNESE